MPKIILYLVLLVSLVGFLYFKLSQKEQLQIYFFDVGQGDASLIRTPEGINILIDGGPDNTLVYNLGQALPWWDREIDYVIISHYHADHLLGLIEMLNKYKVKNILTTAHHPDDYLYQVWVESLVGHNLVETTVRAGDRFIVNDNLYWQVISADASHEDFNDNSLVFKFSYYDFDIFYTGDFTSVEEDNLLETEYDLSAEILKVGHHGSRYSSSESWLAAISPTWCVIQSGVDNKFGHPHAELLARLKKADCQIMRTDQGGAIVFSRQNGVFVGQYREL